MQPHTNFGNSEENRLMIQPSGKCLNVSNLPQFETKVVFASKVVTIALSSLALLTAAVYAGFYGNSLLASGETTKAFFVFGAVASAAFAVFLEISLVSKKVWLNDSFSQRFLSDATFNTGNVAFYLFQKALGVTMAGACIGAGALGLRFTYNVVSPVLWVIYDNGVSPRLVNFLRIVKLFLDLFVFR